MDSLSFDRLARLFASGTSRRRMLRAAGASSLGALGLAAVLGPDGVSAKKGGKKRRCKKFNATCNQNNKKCCQGLKCEEGSCCRKLGTKCEEDGSECCGGSVCDNVEVGSQQKFCCYLENSENNSCQKDSHCCEGFTCNEQTNRCVEVL